MILIMWLSMVQANQVSIDRWEARVQYCLADVKLDYLSLGFEVGECYIDETELQHLPIDVANYKSAAGVKLGNIISCLEEARNNTPFNSEQLAQANAFIESIRQAGLGDIRTIGDNGLAINRQCMADLRAQ